MIQEMKLKLIIKESIEEEMNLWEMDLNKMLEPISLIKAKNN